MSINSAIAPGDKFNRLTAIKIESVTPRGRRWLFKCDCGKKHVAAAKLVKFGSIKSCGCLFREKISLPRAGKHKMSNTPEYRTWSYMRRRCSHADENPRHGGRGIVVSERWETFTNFYADMGPRPSSRHSLDRINNDGNYEKGNCRWATAKTQARNRNNSITVTVFGKSMPLADAASALGIKYVTLYWRIKHNRPTVGVSF